MSKIEQDLAALGETRPQVYAKLKELGIKGKKGSSCSCPIARYLTHKGYRVLGVSSGYISIVSIPHDYVVPHGVGCFIKKFDLGMYPDLEDRS
jgi:hypothetical protein